VDDEPAITELLCAALEEDGFVCYAAHSGPEALALLARRPCAFVLTDVRMPGMSGLDLLEQVRAHHQDTFVLLLTGSADVEMVTRAFRAGACDFLTKPFSLDELRDRMQVAEERRREMLREREADQTKTERLERLAARFDGMVRGVVSSLAMVLDTKHPQTRAHSDRVALRVAEVASALELPAEDVEALYVAGLLHDIGKIAVDSTILEKSGKLDEEEFDQIRSHPAESARIVDPVALSPVVVDAIRHHHERWDGEGYPDGLAGEAIPLAARILAVCDAFDAMTNERTYRPALPVSEGLARLQAGAGKQWDPAIVEVLRALETAEASPAARLEDRPASTHQPVVE
jgi:putative nucleotidyltransferase with HDIG domain